MPAVGSRNPLSVQYLDAHGKVQSVRLYAGEITAVNIAGFLSDYGTLKNALDAVTLGNRSQESWGEETTVTNAPPANDNASVATEIIVRYRGATTEKPYSFRIPTADYDAFNYASPPNGDSIIMSGAGATAATTALVAALEALCKTPDDNGEAIVVTGMNIVE